MTFLLDEVAIITWAVPFLAILHLTSLSSATLPHLLVHAIPRLDTYETRTSGMGADSIIF